MFYYIYPFHIHSSKLSHTKAPYVITGLFTLFLCSPIFLPLYIYHVGCHISEGGIKERERGGEGRGESERLGYLGDLILWGKVLGHRLHQNPKRLIIIHRLREMGERYIYS